jgi:hypothetical protein
MNRKRLQSYRTSSFNRIVHFAVCGVLFALAATSLMAQDTRTVTEPSFPPACTVLTANQAAGSLDETNFDTVRVQAALNSCAVGQAVELAAQDHSNAFLIQPITIPSGVTLLVDAGVTVFTSLNRADYPCPSSSSSDCTPLITVAPGSGSGIMGYGIIDGRGGNTLNGETVSWWTQVPLDPRPRMIQMVHSDNFTLYKITLQNSPKFHVFGTGNFFTAWGVKITAPTTSPNTDGIDPSGSHDITITNSYISDGDDHIAIKAGVGHVSNITISHNRLFQGHGVSIGSETNAGAENILVTDFVMDGANALNQNVIRIKSDSSKGGEIRNITYENICARNPGHPLVFNPFNSSSTGTLFPNMHDIVVHNMHVLNRQNSSTVEGYFNATGTSFPLGITLNNVALDGFKTTGTPDFPPAQVNHVNFILGPDPVTPVSPGVVSIINGLAANPANLVTVTNNVSNSNPPFPCTASSFVFLAGELFTPPGTVVTDGTITLNAIVQPIVFGAAAPTGTINILEGTAVVASAPVAGRITPISISGVGDGTHNYTAQYSGDANYALLNFGSVTLAGTTTTLTPSANPVVYGDSVTLSASVTSDSGVPTGTVKFLDGTTLLSTSTLDGSGKASFTTAFTAGTHPITVSYSGAPAFNVSTSAPVSLIVTPAPLTVTAANASKLYGAPVPPLTGSIVGIKNGDNITATYATTATQSSPAGTYPIVPALVDPDSKLGNYAVTVINGTLTINPAPLTITADDASKILNAPNPAFTASYSGFVLGEGPSVLSGVLNCTTTAVLNSPVGGYPIACSGQSSPNYAITYVAGTLHIIFAPTGACVKDKEPSHQILQPINADGSTVFNGNGPIDVKFRVCDANGVSQDTGVTASIRLTNKIQGTLNTAVDLPVDPKPGTNGFAFGEDQLWLFRIDSRQLAGGLTYVFRIDLNDGTHIDFQFGRR